MTKLLIVLIIVSVASTAYVVNTTQPLNKRSTNNTNDSAALVQHLRGLIANEKNPLLKRHFESLLLITQDETHAYPFKEKNQQDAAKVLQFMKQEGQLWETYLEKPRPLIMAFKSATDKKNSYYWLFLPKDFAKNKTKY